MSGVPSVLSRKKRQARPPVGSLPRSVQPFFHLFLLPCWRPHLRGTSKHTTEIGPLPSQRSIDTCKSTRSSSPTRSAPRPFNPDVQFRHPSGLPPAWNPNVNNNADFSRSIIHSKDLRGPGLGNPRPERLPPIRLWTSSRLYRVSPALGRSWLGSWSERPGGS